MSLLKVFSADQAQLIESIENHDRIATRLRDAGVLFERWQASQPLDHDASQEAIIEAYRPAVDRLMQEYGFQSVDVIALGPDHPDRVALRQKFLDEHVHSEFEVRFFVDGQGLFYIHQGDKVYAVLCQQGDLISVPANTKHWFDMGAAPSLKCIRLFTSTEGWVAQYTGDKIAAQFPRVEQFTA
ncbi:cupin [Candidatus Tenderia electrophaga]|jgi:1,2-dihydroxy-3-keto-5-methylthiopentene dioxygenase|uniref:Acireductone dioxygenase n=1 Tax=Candidatus Tenderia electrophaga TaxID=1748243 RepID=A0A0S2TD34_9GAMM|nr:cupin [Candidatus Tenderia electrophaga]